MKRGLLVAIAISMCVFLMFSRGALAADSLPGEAAPTNVPGYDYPRVLSDHRAIFQLKAPKARSVAVEISDQTYPMTKDSDGAWSVTTPPLVVGFHYYALVLDGVRINDPGSRTYYGTGNDSSAIEIPEAGVDYYLEQNVPHGDVRIRLYHSKVTGKWRRAYVYTPPGYDDHPDKHYPVLYLQHGSNGDETGWTFQGHANLILDNLIAEKKAVPMIVVMDNCYAHRPGETGQAPQIASPLRPDFPAFEAVMLEDVIPMIDATFRTIPDRDHRAIAGLSMGANAALRVGTGNLDKFAYIAGFSGGMNGLHTAPLDPATAFGGRFKDGAAFNAKVKLLWLGMGTAEPVPFPAAIGSFRKMLDDAGIHYVFYSSPGTAHEWLTWRRDLHDFAPRLFK